MSEELIGQMLPPDPSEPPQDPRADEMSDEALEAAIDGQQAIEDGDGLVPEPTPPQEPAELEVTESKPDNEVPAEAAPVEVPPAAPSVEPTEVPTEAPPAALDPLEELKLQMAQDRAKAELESARLQQHNSRLAGQLGHLKNKLSQEPPAEPEYGTDPVIDSQGTDRVSQLEQKLFQMEKQQHAEARDAAILEVVAQYENLPDVKAIPPEILAQATQAYKKDWQDAITAEDPHAARLLAKGVIANVTADAKRAAYDLRVKTVQEQANSGQAQLEADRADAAASGAGSVSAQESRPKPKTVSQLKDDELDDLIDSKIARG